MPLLVIVDLSGSKCCWRQHQQRRGEGFIRPRLQVDLLKKPLPPPSQRRESHNPALFSVYPNIPTYSQQTLFPHDTAAIRARL